jgi:hypothetical protein
MKALKYIFAVLGIAVMVSACAPNDPTDRVLDSKDSFVTFDTKSGSVKTITVAENNPAGTLVSISVGAYKGPSMTVDFEVQVPATADPASALYKLLNLDGSEMTSRTLTFPEGTGEQSFFFVPVDNEILDGNRTFNLKLTANSAGYRLGVNPTEEGVVMPITVRDDEHPLKNMVGSYAVTEIYKGEVSEVGTVSIITGEADDTIIVEAFPLYQSATLRIPIVVEADRGAVTIYPMAGYSTPYGSVLVGAMNEDGDVEAKPLEGVIEEDGSMFFEGTLGVAFEPGGVNSGLFSYWGGLHFVKVK